jgi:hypothetical protein
MICHAGRNRNGKRVLYFQPRKPPPTLEEVLIGPAAANYSSSHLPANPQLIDGPTPRNKHGFKFTQRSNDNTQSSSSSSSSNNNAGHKSTGSSSGDGLTICSMELHGNLIIIIISNFYNVNNNQI